ncbi:MAG: large subunit ribosomal protein [Thermoanaerobaculia bacterium]|jgi:large subunit ribosomal protein L20|nr:large subunit ribosomal protein [Thermoanaerobaculia bacterium]
MPRVKRGTKRKDRRSKILKLAKGYWGMKSRGHRIAKQQVEKALNSAFAGRKDRKGDFRKLWIARINAAARLNGISYSQLIAGLKASGSLVDRKILADIAVRDAAAFTAFVESAKAALNKAQLRTALDKETAAKRPAAKQPTA